MAIELQTKENEKIGKNNFLIDIEKERASHHHHHRHSYRIDGGTEDMSELNDTDVIPRHVI